jgi:large subunit ribosomal protein L22
MVTAELKNYRQSPRKVRLVADAIRGKKVAEALDILLIATQRAAAPLKKLVESAIANAEHNHSLKSEDLFVKEIRVDEGVTLHRWRARARGRAAPIKKRCSHVKIVLDTKETPKEAPKKTSKKASAKKNNK